VEVREWFAKCPEAGLDPLLFADFLDPWQVDRRRFGALRGKRFFVPLYIVEKLVGGIILFDLRGRITLGRETETFRRKIRQLLEAGQRRLILDLGEITYIDSVGLSTLVASLTSVRKQGGDLKLVRLPQGVHQLLQITRLVTVFEIHNSLESALQAFNRKAV
jgi:anti-sigma B factor antagonist